MATRSGEAALVGVNQRKTPGSEAAIGDEQSQMQSAGVRERDRAECRSAGDGRRCKDVEWRRAEMEGRRVKKDVECDKRRRGEKSGSWRSWLKWGNRTRTGGVMTQDW